MKKVLIGLALVAILGVAAGAFYLYQQHQTEQRQKDEAEAAQAADTLIQSIEATLQNVTPVSWVYDADDTLLFAIRVSDEASATTSVPEVIAAGLRERYANDLATRVVRVYMTENKMGGKSDYFVECMVKQLNERVGEDNLLRYMTTAAIYGNINGLENAAIEYFNRDVGHLNSWQCDFLLYAYENPGAGVTDYLASVGKTAEQLDFVQQNARNTALESLLRTEIQKIPEVHMGAESYTIKLSLSATQQHSMQSSVDSYMRSYIDLSSNGTYVLNASVVVLDNLTGLVTAYIPGRTVSSLDAKEFEMNTGIWSENFSALISRIATPGQTRYSLQKVKLPNGDFTFVGTGQQWDTQTLATGVSNTGTAMDILQQIKVMVLSSSPSLVQQVKNLAGEVIYEAPVPQMQPPNNKTVLKLRQCFAEDDVDSTVMLQSMLRTSAGVISFEMTREYTAVILLGSGSIGAELSDDTVTSLVSTTSSIMQDVKSFFPTPKTSMYARTQEMADEFATTYATNYDLLSEGLGEKFNALEAMPIVSSETRRAFEDEYERLSAELKSLESFVSREAYAELTERLYEIRQERAEAILIYSV